MITREGYEEMILALGRYYKEIGETNVTLLQQINAMKEAMDDDYADELCDNVSSFIEKVKVYQDDIISVQMALTERMESLFERV